MQEPLVIERGMTSVGSDRFRRCVERGRRAEVLGVTMGTGATPGTDDAKRITDLTLAHYEDRADDFWEGTRDHDVSQNVAAPAFEHRGRAAVRDPRFRDAGRARSQDACVAWATWRSDSKARRALQQWRARSAGARSGSRISCGSICRRPLRRHLRQRVALSRPERGPAAGAARVARGIEAARRALLLESPWAGRGGLESRALRCLPSARDVARAWRRRAASSKSTTTFARRGCRDEQQPWLATVWRKAGA